MVAKIFENIKTAQIYKHFSTFYKTLDWKFRFE